MVAAHNISKKRFWNTIPVVLRLLLALVFVSSAVSKLFSAEAFKEFVAAIPWLSQVNATLLVSLTIGAELVLAGLLIFRRTCRIGALMSFGVLVAFTLLLGYASLMQVSVSCGCFGDLLGESSLDYSILRNIFLLLLSALVISTGPSTAEQARVDTHAGS